MFQVYKEWREIQDFDVKFTKLCEVIIEKRIPFDQVWERCILPALYEARTEDMLFENIFSGLKNAFGMGKTPKTSPAPGFDTYMNQAQRQHQPSALDRYLNKAQQQYYQPPPVPEQPPAVPGQPQPPPMPTAQQQQDVQSLGKNAEQWVTQVKKDFGQAMRQFLKTAKDKATDAHQGRVADLFYQRIMKTIEPIMQQWKVSASFGQTPDYINQWKQAQQGRQQALQKKLTNKWVPENVPMDASASASSAGGGDPFTQVGQRAAMKST